METVDFGTFLKAIEETDTIQYGGVRAKEYLDALIKAFKELEDITKNKYEVELI